VVSLALLLAPLTIGAALTAVAVVRIQDAWWRRHDRREIERRLRREVRAEARRAGR